MPVYAAFYYLLYEEPSRITEVLAGMVMDSSDIET